ncbi:MAG TPA: hypothetical protein VGM93_06400 [Acidimicrobiales bacterium]
MVQPVRVVVAPADDDPTSADRMARDLRNDGHEVIRTGSSDADAIAAIALQEDAVAIGLPDGSPVSVTELTATLAGLDLGGVIVLGPADAGTQPSSITERLRSALSARSAPA